MTHPNHLLNTHILIFGGTSGVGFAVASLALSSAAHVTISGSTQSKVDEKVALLHSYYPSLPKSHVCGYACDLLDTQNLDANLDSLFERATEKGAKKVNHVVFTAGDKLAPPNIRTATLDALLSGLHIRFVACALIAKHLLNPAYMPFSSSSSFTLSGGSNTHKPMPGWFAGAGWGGAVEGLTRGLAVDLKPIRVNMVELGVVDTELLQGMGMGEEIKEGLGRQTLVGSIGRVEDVAEAYGWFMRDGFVTGVTAATNGGRLLV